MVHGTWDTTLPFILTVTWACCDFFTAMNCEGTEPFHSGAPRSKRSSCRLQRWYPIVLRGYWTTLECNSEATADTSAIRDVISELCKQRQLLQTLQFPWHQLSDNRKFCHGFPLSLTAVFSIDFFDACPTICPWHFKWDCVCMGFWSTHALTKFDSKSSSLFPIYCNLLFN